ncbi:hypothetical protein GCM10022223_51570 [Kineosporia mesophila]|uniref:Uncharacterized protein n=1 Tax=Kineosporia mesophila TaxID=566012 RepID=A0ABP7AA56_9ACTN|nr:hypothetical protein [Kineosporia mesophila]MCD5354656.1 hypothetical protein [Kineosporia mesophila]
MRTQALLGGGFGAALIIRPRTVLRSVGADPALPGLVLTTRVLGARHLVQAAALGLAPARVAPWAVRVDGLHVASMLALAGLPGLNPGYRRAALASAGVATALGTGAFTTHARSSSAAG